MDQPQHKGAMRALLSPELGAACSAPAALQPPCSHSTWHQRQPEPRYWEMDGLLAGTICQPAAPPELPNFSKKLVPGSQQKNPTRGSAYPPAESPGGAACPTAHEAYLRNNAEKVLR